MLLLQKSLAGWEGEAGWHQYRKLSAAVQREGERGNYRDGLQLGLACSLVSLPAAYIPAEPFFG